MHSKSQCQRQWSSILLGSSVLRDCILLASLIPLFRSGVAWQTGRRIAHACRVRMAKAAQRREKKLKEEIKQKDAQLSLVKASCSETVAIFGGLSTAVGRKRAPEDQDLLPLVYACQASKAQRFRLPDYHARF